jgi:putative FmdB family regulatory protein
MPNWDFKCNMCDAVIEHLIKDGDEFPKCVDCNVTLSKMYSATPSIFRGGGWGGK